MAKLVILGATGTIGRSLVHSLTRQARHELVLLGRDERKLSQLAQHAVDGSKIKTAGLGNLSEVAGDVILNCLGAGDPRTISSLGPELVHLTEAWDNSVFQRLGSNPECLYLSFSSGVVFGHEWAKPVTSATPVVMPVNGANGQYHYAVAKLNSEIKHRASEHLNIVDLRLFGYASRFIDPDGSYFLSHVMKALRDKSVLQTSPREMIRDYVHPDDLSELVELCLGQRPGNRAFDVYSLQPTTKVDLLETLGAALGLVWETVLDDQLKPTGIEKYAYYSTNHEAESIGFHPQYSAAEAVVTELEGYLSTLHG